MSSWEEKVTINEHFKVLVIGAHYSGKTSAIHKFLRDRLSWPTYPTLGFEYHPWISHHSPTNKTIRLQIWDTSGQKKYRQIILQHFQRVQGALVFFDISSKDSFNEIDSWYSELRRTCGNHCAVILVGSKGDLSREVCIYDAINWAEEKNMSYLETSIMWDPQKDDGINVGIGVLFEKLTTLMIDKNTKEEKTFVSHQPQPRKSCFC